MMNNQNSIDFHEIINNHAQIAISTPNQPVNHQVVSVTPTAIQILLYKTEFQLCGIRVYQQNNQLILCTIAGENATTKEIVLIEDLQNDPGFDPIAFDDDPAAYRYPEPR